ncbi:MAG: hypothetical protein WB239_12460, partial [Acidimicrobiia bacterium]
MTTWMLALPVLAVAVPILIVARRQPRRWLTRLLVFDGVLVTLGAVVAFVGLTAEPASASATAAASVTAQAATTASGSG